MSKLPHVKFELDKEVDKFMASKFLDYRIGTVDYSDGVWGPHPSLKGVTGKDIYMIDEYFNKFYSNNLLLLNNLVESFTQEWDKIEKKYLKKCTDFFNGFTFPSGDYIGYVSIINCNPRFLETCSFQLFYKSKSCVPTTAHELMHFIFYSYITRNSTKAKKDEIESSGAWWLTSEIFNNVVLDLPEFRELLGGYFEEPHLGHEEYFESAKKLYEESANIDEFIDMLYQFVNQAQK